jgi:hypothetical protein
MSVAIAEEWKPIPSLGGRYLASSAGRIMGPHGHPLALKRHMHGYHLFAVSAGGGASRNVSVARSVCEAFHGPAPEDSQVDHIDRVRDHDDPANLRWVTKAENLAHRQNLCGEAHSNARLTESAVKAIRQSEEPSSALAALYQVSPRTIRDARSGKLWKHVNG